MQVLERVHLRSSVLQGPSPSLSFGPNHNRFLVNFKSFLDNNESQSYLRDYSISSVLEGSVVAAARNNFPCSGSRTKFLCDSCDGMICMATNPSCPIVWNPSTGKFKELPRVDQAYGLVYGLGYDDINDSYKVVATLNSSKTRLLAGDDYQFDSLIYTLGSDSWRHMHGFPGLVVKDSSGKFVSGTLNWLVCDANNFVAISILSLDLATETYQTLTSPVDRSFLGVSTVRSAVVKGWLCIVASRILYGDVFPELFRFYMAPLWVSDEGDEILLDYLGMLTVYSSRNGGSFRAPGIHQIFRGSMLAVLYTETLMSPS